MIDVFFFQIEFIYWLHSDPEWKQFKDVYDSDKKWIQSQFVPLNYLFDKLKVIEDETKELRVCNLFTLFDFIFKQ